MDNGQDSSGKPDIHSALAAVINSLEGGDIEHFAAADALVPLFENWTALRNEGAGDGDPESMAEDLMDQYDRLIDVLKALRPHAAQALSELVTAPAPR